MTPSLQVDYLLAYTDWDRVNWESWFREQGPSAFAVSLGANGDGRMTNVGELVRHIFSAEQRYVDRIQDRPITDTSTVPTNDVEALFDFGRQSRRNLRQVLHDFPAERWDVPQELVIGSTRRVVSARTMLVQAQ